MKWKVNKTTWPSVTYGKLTGSKTFGSVKPEAKMHCGYFPMLFRFLFRVD